MPYNLTLINSTGMVSLVQTINSNLMFHWFGSLAMVAFWTIVYMSISKDSDSVSRDFSIASFMTFILALLLRALSLVPDVVIFIPLFVTLAATITYFIRSN